LQRRKLLKEKGMPAPEPLLRSTAQRPSSRFAFT
jgi:hypothetical protein